MRRFADPWEKTASIELRIGNPDAIDSYGAHGRIQGGERSELLVQLFQSWKADIEAGKSSLMIAGDAATVAELNRLAPEDRVAAGRAQTEGLAVADNQKGAVGDMVVNQGEQPAAHHREAVGEERGPLDCHSHP